MSKSETYDCALAGVTDDADDDVLPIAARVATARQKKGWAGDEMEMNHQRECYSKERNNKSISGTATSFTAVDLSQFRNTEVGHGYQAKGVVRQRSVTRAADTIDRKNDLVMKGPTQKSNDKNCSTAEERRDVHKSQRRKRKLRGEQIEYSKPSLTNAYLHSKGIRDFRRELGKILGETNS